MSIHHETLAREIYESNCHVGWWDDKDRCIFTTMQLCVTEIAEATEGDRKDLMDDKLPHRKMCEVELADTWIRVLDLGGRFELQYYATAIPHKWTRHINTVAGKLLGLTASTIDFAEAYESYNNSMYYKREFSHTYSVLINSIEYLAIQMNYNLNDAVKEKMEYNKTRADHKRENREKEGGKKY